jgi:sugar transferase (PEP-CTERM system associated)
MIRFLHRYWSIPAVVSVLVEAALLMGSVWLAFFLRFRGELSIGGFTPYQFVLRAWLFASVVQLAFYLGGVYDFKNHLSLRELNIRLWRAFAVGAATLFAIYYLFPGLFMGRGLFALSLFFSLFAVTCWRLALFWLLERKLFEERVLIVGADEKARALAREILDRRHRGYDVVGFLDDDPDLLGVSIVNPRVLGTTAEAKAVALETRATRIVVARRDFRGWLNMDSLLSCKTAGVPVEKGEKFFERLTGMIALDGLRKSWLVFSEGFVVHPTTLLWKRVIDAIVASGMLLITAPIMLLTAIAIRLESPGPVLFSQERVGKDGKVFLLRKFRSMSQDAEAAGEAIWAEANDSRVTRVGHLIRKTRIDELPQLWNVLAGQMSLVGPRPERPKFVAQLSELNALYEQRLVVRPGLTGWAQINASYAASFEASLEKLQFDLFYIKNLSVLLDFSIMVSTAKTVLLARGGR